MADITVRDLTPQDHEWARAFITRMQGSERIARLGELVDPLAMEGLIAEADGQSVGLASVNETADKGLEIVLLLAEPSGMGAGSALMETARQVATASGHHRLWLVTTNDNLAAIHFYLRRGMRLAAVHENAVEADRALKPEIPKVSATNGLPISDLLEMELTGEALDRRLETAPFPAIDDLDRLPAAAFVAEQGPLVEGAPRFLARLAGERPFGSDEAMLAAAFEVAHGMPEDERIELIDSHPRIGADAAEVSEMSYVEQGYEAESSAEEEATDDREETLSHLAEETARAYEELAMLNGIYEEQFGFRYVIFVAGRPKTEIVPLLERALRNDREAELRRAVDDAIYIAGDRLRRLRGLGTEV